MFIFFFFFLSKFSKFHTYLSSPSGFGEHGRMDIYFWEVGRNAKYFRGAGDLAPNFGEPGSTVRKKYF